MSDCLNCQKEISENANFCPFCGESVSVDEPMRIDQREMQSCISCEHPLLPSWIFCERCGMEQSK